MERPATCVINFKKDMDIRAKNAGRTGVPAVPWHSWHNATMVNPPLITSKFGRGGKQSIAHL
jgi:hypothetical protein